MDPAYLQAFVTAGGTVTASYVSSAAYKRWRRSHRPVSIDESEAEELWNEGRSLRTFLKEQVDQLQTQIDNLSQRYTDLLKRYDSLADANEGLKFALEEAQQLVVALKAEREELRLEIKRLKAANEALTELNARLQRLLDAHNIPTPQ